MIGDDTLAMARRMQVQSEEYSVIARKPKSETLAHLAAARPSHAGASIRNHSGVALIPLRKSEHIRHQAEAGSKASVPSSKLEGDGGDVLFDFAQQILPGSILHLPGPCTRRQARIQFQTDSPRLPKLSARA